MFDNIGLTPRQSVEWLFECIAKIEKHHVVSLFLASLSTNRVEWRCGLSAFALCKNLPVPNYSYSVNDISLNEHIKEIDLSFHNNCRFTFGTAMIGDDIFDYSYIAFCLDQHIRLPICIPNEKDIFIFNEIINTILEMRKGDTPNDLEKRLASKKIFKASHWQRRYILEILGFCSVIENPNAKGYLNHFVYKDKRYLDNHLSEWNYPIRLWKGEDSINREALEFWFGDFIE